MLKATRVTTLEDKQKFYHHCNIYVTCDEAEMTKHPAFNCDGVLAYHYPRRGPRVPVRFSPQETVFIDVEVT